MLQTLVVSSGRIAIYSRNPPTCAVGWEAYILDLNRCTRQNWEPGKPVPMPRGRRPTMCMLPFCWRVVLQVPLAPTLKQDTRNHGRPRIPHASEIAPGFDTTGFGDLQSRCVCASMPTTRRGCPSVCSAKVGERRCSHDSRENTQRDDPRYVVDRPAAMHRGCISQSRAVSTHRGEYATIGMRSAP